MAKTKKATKKRIVVIEPVGQAHINATFNNIIVTLTNNQGGKVAYDLGLRKVEVFVKGPGAGRESAIRTLQTVGIDVTVIKDITPLPHNGCRPPKRRRV